MQKSGRYLLFILFCLLIGRGSLPAHSNAEETLPLNANGNDFDGIEYSFPNETGSDEVTVQADPPPPTPVKSYFNGVAYSSPLVIPAAAFRGDGVSEDRYIFFFEGGYLLGTTTGVGCVMAPAYLPDQATADVLYATVYTNDASEHITIYLRRVNNFTGEQEIMAGVATGGTSARVRTIDDSKIDKAFIESQKYSYYVTTCLRSPGIRLYAVLITFHKE